MTIAPRLERVVPRLVVAFPVLFNLWFLRGETTIVQNLNDSHLHLAMVRWARDQILEGKIPVDGWFPYLGLGYSQFRHYPTLPHTLTAYVSVLTGVPTAYFWSIYLVLALWPVSVYLGTRLMGWDRWAAAGAALVSPMLVSASAYGFEQGSYVWSGYGVWAQMWAMLLLPIALGFTWRAIGGTGFYALAALVVGLTIASHFVVAYVALLAIGLWAIVVPRQILPRLGRAIAVGAGSLLVAGWTVVPLFQDLAWRPVSEFGRGNTFSQGFGIAQVVQWLVTGQLYDAGRLPVVSVLVGTGLVACLLRFHRDPRSRAIVGLWLVSLALMSGTATFGTMLQLLPGSSNLPWHRFIVGVHITGVVLAGVGLTWLARQVIRLGARLLPRLLPRLSWGLAMTVVMVLAIIALFPGWNGNATADTRADLLRANQVAVEATDGKDLQVLMDSVKTLGDGRVYAGGRWSWGQDYRLGYVPVYTVLSNNDIDGVGLKLRVSSLMTDEEMLFDEKNPAQYDLFNIRYLILPADHPPPVKATQLAQSGRHTLWRVDTSGYLEVVDTVSPPIVDDKTNVASRTLGFLASEQLTRLQFPTIAYNGQMAADPSLAPGTAAAGPAGQVISQESAPADGIFKGEAVANRPAVVLLKVSYDPRWTLSVDGVDRPIQMIAPALMGGAVPAGRHTVVFRYVPDPEYPFLFAIGMLSLFGLWGGPRLLRRGKLPLLWIRREATPRVASSDETA